MPTIPNPSSSMYGPKLDNLAAIAPTGPQVPHVQPPSGGGKIRSMGETFLANPSTGSSSFSIPIATSPARNGMNSNLALSYSSGLGNGDFGVGWSLNVGSISRRTSRGLPRYEDEIESDTFIIAGYEDLVPVSSTTQNGYQVKNYMPRAATTFPRIERWTNQADAGDVYWRVTSGENVTSIYGRSDASRIFDFDHEVTAPGRKRIFSWLLSEVYDDRGNVVSYIYKAENNQNISLSEANERNRSETSRSTHRYLKYIRYGNRIPNRDVSTWAILETPVAELPAESWCFEVVFDYGEHSLLDPNPSDDNGWLPRMDVFSTYRAGFEERTYRLCRRVLMFHRFPQHLRRTPALLVSSLDLEYSESPNISFLKKAVQKGYIPISSDSSLVGAGSGPYFSRELPVIELDYTASPKDTDMLNVVVSDVDVKSMENVPAGIQVAGDAQLVDLFGTGSDGILSTGKPNGWFFKPGYGASNAIASLENGTIKAEPTFGPFHAVQQVPNIGIRPQLVDIGGAGGVDVLLQDQALRGFWPSSRALEGEDSSLWKNFEPFKSWPMGVDFNDPNLRLVDLTGDGLADILITEDSVFTYYPSLGLEGYGPPCRVFQRLDEENAPRVLFSDLEEAVYLSDMCGDGLPDLCRIRNGSICYWPNLGYGRFGAKVAMDNAPLFDAYEAFSQRRLLLCDVAGSGTTDIIYVGNDQATVYFNESGNRWSLGKPLPVFLPPIDTLSHIFAADLLGNGTNCLVWSTARPDASGSTTRYIDFNHGIKPHLLQKISNGFGKETRLSYLPSTTFYLRDRDRGTPWVTRLNYPVQCLERVQVYDRVSQIFYSTKYAYHHGHFDPIDREFRGFGMVEQWDTEEYEQLVKLNPEDAKNISKSSYVPPMHLKKWFYTGAYLEGRKVLRQYAREYFGGAKLDATAFERFYEDSLIKDVVIDEGTFPAEDVREAMRCLKGSLIREELYCEDGTELASIPIQITEAGHNVRVVRQGKGNSYAVCQMYQRETVLHKFERSLEDPRVTQNINLSINQHGAVLESVSIAHGRRPNKTKLEGDMKRVQELTRIVYVANDYTNAINTTSDYRLPALSQTAMYEVTGLSMAKGSRFAAEDFVSIGSIPSIAYTSTPSPDTPGKRLISKLVTRFRSDDLGTLLPQDSLQSQGLFGQAFTLCLTPDLLSYYKEHIDDKALSTTLREKGGYVDLNGDGDWWIPSTKGFFDHTPGSNDDELQSARTQFFTHGRILDPFGNTSYVDYDPDFLMVRSSEDAVGNRQKLENDYRVLKPAVFIDANGNRTEVSYDCFGEVAGVALIGKVNEQQPNGEGDSLKNFHPELPDEAISAFVADPVGTAPKLLGSATSRFVNFFDYDASVPQPPVTAKLSRQRHTSDPMARTQPIVIEFTYMDGSNRSIQSKVLADSDPSTPDIPRWICSERIVLNNKGSAVRKYQPFFDQTHEFTRDEGVGVATIYIRDALDRIIAMVNPDKSWSKQVYNTWDLRTYDANDTVLQDPSIDPHVGQYFKRLPSDSYLPTWYQQRVDGAMGKQEQRAAEKTASHNETPETQHSDSLGNPLARTRNNGGEIYTEFTARDIQGFLVDVKDARGRVVQRVRHDLRGSTLYLESMDAGKRWSLIDVSGAIFMQWDSRGQRWRHEYDALRRPTETYLQTNDGREIVYLKRVYGENEPIAQQSNLRGRLFATYDQAGVHITDQYDFRGNLLHSSRQFAQEYKIDIDWADIKDVRLEPQIHTEKITFNALNKVVSHETPDMTVRQYTYGRSGLLKTLDTNYKGKRNDRTNERVWETYLNNVEYDEKGQPTRIVMGNKSVSENRYDPFTQRLISRATFSTIGNRRVKVQGIQYAYDPVGNITSLVNGAEQDVFFRNNSVSPDAGYTYDSLYRLVEATGREQLGQTKGKPSSPSTPSAFDFLAADNSSDAATMATYTEYYQYDSTDNITQVKHQPDDAQYSNWTRDFFYQEPSLLDASVSGNRLSYTTVGNQTETYKYSGTAGLHGNMTSMSHLSLMEWNPKDQLRCSAQQRVADGATPEITWYVYDAGGSRVRKVTDSYVSASNDSVPRKRKENLYLEDYEVYHSYNGDGITPNVSCETVHVRAETKVLATIEDWKGDSINPTVLFRYRLLDHLNTISVELDENGGIVSYEEHSPYGNSTYRLADKYRPKRYRWTGKERDQENGLYYCEARYYAPWICRWTAADPIGIQDGLNVYAYVGGNPIMHTDPTGLMKTGFFGGSGLFGGSGPRGLRQFSTLLPTDKTLYDEIERIKKNFAKNPHFQDEQFSKDFGEKSELGKRYDEGTALPFEIAPDKLSEDEVKKNARKLDKISKSRAKGPGREINHVSPKGAIGLIGVIFNLKMEMSFPVAGQYHKGFTYGAKGTEDGEDWSSQMKYIHDEIAAPFFEELVEKNINFGTTAFEETVEEHRKGVPAKTTTFYNKRGILLSMTSMDDFSSWKKQSSMGYNSIKPQFVLSTTRLREWMNKDSEK